MVYLSSKYVINYAQSIQPYLRKKYKYNRDGSASYKKHLIEYCTPHPERKMSAYCK